MIPDMYTAAVLVQSKVSIEPPQHRPSARAASARAALSTPSERRDRTQMPSVLGESRESCRLNNTASQQQTAVVYIGVYNELPSESSSFAHNTSSWRSMAHIHRIFPPRRRSEGSWLRAGREWACTRPLLRSVYAASVLVCRVKPRRCVIPVLLLLTAVVL